MKQFQFLLSICVVFLLMSSQIIGQSFLKRDGKIITNENGDTVLLRGMGLGGWMLQEGYMLQTAGFANAQYQIRNEIEQLIGTTDTDLFYDAWLANHVRKADIDSLKAWGFNSVRLPMHYNLFTLPIQDEPVIGQNTWLTKGFELTDSLISWCAQNQMYVILDLHAAPGGQGQDQGISDYNPALPSLWQNQFNRDKTVALWKKLAERYVNEPWVAGYDLLNEVNWNLPGGVALRALYEEITDSIRTVDTDHIIFIEGNWFANDFTGLTPPWDSNMVYSPHKYWSYNFQNDIQWVLTIRDQYNYPLYFGECGENSNLWFRDAIKLFEDNNIGWAWWPMKKIESIAGPLSIVKSAGYQSLLDYWDGNGTQPSAAFAKSVLMQLTDDLKIENCRFQPDVIDAMFRQVNSNETVPYTTLNIPGVIQSTDFDMGTLGNAYFDNQAATYHVSTGNFTAWNNGWAYRNDGVDIEPCSDVQNNNGYNVGWIDTDEWMQYTVNVAADAVYDVEVRVATQQSGGEFHFMMDGADVSAPVTVSSTNGWQSWQTVTVNDVVLNTTDKKLRFYADIGGFNMNSIKFIQKGSSTSLATEFLSAFTTDENTIQLNLNKALASPLPASPADFQIFADGVAIPITATVLNTNNPRIITFTVNHLIEYGQVLKISYNGSSINAQDGTALTQFTLEDVENRIPRIHQIPGKIEAEEYFDHVGIQLETTTDNGGGQNVGYLDVGDYMDYEVEVASSATYQVDFRTASQGSTGQVKLILIDDLGNTTDLTTVSFPSTGGWQTWQTTTASVTLPAGIHILRVEITQPQFNMNWYEFNYTTDVNQVDVGEHVAIFPNPSAGLFNIDGKVVQQQDLNINVVNLLGQVVLEKRLEDVTDFQTQIDLNDFPAGQYFIRIHQEDGQLFTKKIIKY